MLTSSDVEQIIKKLPYGDMQMTNYDLSKEVSSIVYRVDSFSYSDTHITNRHIDIEFCFGDYYELYEKDDLFQWIYSLCNLQAFTDEKEIILY